MIAAAGWCVQAYEPLKLWEPDMADGQDGMMEAQMKLSYFHVTSHVSPTERRTYLFSVLSETSLLII